MCLWQQVSEESQNYAVLIRRHVAWKLVWFQFPVH